MSKSFDEQQEYIDALQRQLDAGREDREYILGLWSVAVGECTWEVLEEGERSTKVYKVRLRPCGHIWGSSSVGEHLAWSNARLNLSNASIFTADYIQARDKETA